MCPTRHGRGVDEAVVLSPDRGRWLGMQCITETLVLYFGGLRLGFAIPPIDFKPRTPEGTHIRLSPRILRGINGDFDAEAKLSPPSQIQAIAYRPYLSDERTIRVSPPILTGINGDFDTGEEMVVFQGFLIVVH